MSDPSDRARDAVLEIGTEEIPARVLPTTIDSMEQSCAKLLEEERASYASFEVFATPRRIVLHIEGVSPVGPPLVHEVRGPAYSVAFDDTGAPTRAALGFARAQGVSVEDLVVEEEARGKFVRAIVRTEGRDARDALKHVFARLVAGLSFPRSMRWGEGEFRFIRPIRWILALWGDDVIDVEIDGIVADRFTSGHRFLSDGVLEIAKAEDYFDRLRAAYCVVDQNERRELISSGAHEAARSIGGRIVEDEGLLSELTYLAEHPVALVGRFDPSLLQLPRAVIVTPMKGHQRYFPVEDDKGDLLPAFVAIRDGLAERLDAVRRGNERVLSARLQDARFFYEEDAKAPLESYVAKLHGIVLHERLGTVMDKVQRVIRLVQAICEKLDTEEPVRRTAARAARLFKADLVTNMVREFPELQGVMGCEYARASGEGDGVAQAILEHYLPRFAGDRLPDSMPGTIVGLADRADTVAGFYGVGIMPTGSEDPYALRRTIAGLVAILLEREVHLPVSWLASEAASLLEGSGMLEREPEETIESIVDAVGQRFRSSLIERGIRYDLVDSVMETGFEDIPDASNRARVLASTSDTEEFELACTSYTRAARIAGSLGHGRIQPALLDEPAEKALFHAYEQAEEAIERALRSKDYACVLREISKLAEPIDVFFRDVLVMVEDEATRENRLALLSRVAALAKKLADLGRVVQRAT